MKYLKMLFKPFKDYTWEDKVQLRRRTIILLYVAAIFVICESLFAQTGPTNSGSNPTTTPGLNITPLMCKGRFINPITDICWSCVMPIKIGKMVLVGKDQEDYDSLGGAGNPFCMCNTTGGLPRIGAKISFWEPVRLTEIVRNPYCFPSLGGMEINLGIDAPRHGRTTFVKNSQSSPVLSFYNAHYYINPIVFWLEALLDTSCLEQMVFDVAYLTEIDPLWDSEELSLIIAPDTALFANMPAQLACVADCAAASAGFPLTELFWCDGCSGSMFPLVGWNASHIGGVRTAELLSVRLINKMHREGLMWSASGSESLCRYSPQIMMNKKDYKLQMTYPVRNTEPIFGKCCHPTGRSTMLWDSLKEFPARGEDFAFQVFRKRDCCQTANIQNFLPKR